MQQIPKDARTRVAWSKPFVVLYALALEPVLHSRKAENFYFSRPRWGGWWVHKQRRAAIAGPEGQLRLGVGNSGCSRASIVS